MAETRQANGGTSRARTDRARRRGTGAPRRAEAGMPAGRMLLRAWLFGTTALLPAAGPALAQAPGPNARPTGGQVVAGSASIGQTAAQTTVAQTSQRAAVEWGQFNVGSQHSVQFVQPNTSAATLNRVVGPDPSVIAGRITATTPQGGPGGLVAIVNQSGVVFAQGSQVNVGSLIASAANITNQNFMAGRMVFDGPARPGATVENHGRITVADRGLAALVGPRVSNTGTIQARLGKVALTGGAEAFTLDLAGDGMLAIDVTQAVRGTPSGNAALVTNSGVVEANGGTVSISAHAASGLVEDMVRQTGRISANTEAGQQGRVALRANGGNLRVEGTVEARGTRAGERGGRIDAQAVGGTVTVAAGARVDASGQAGGGAVQVGGRTTRAARVEGQVQAQGTGRGARGGAVAVQAADSVTVAAGAAIDVSGRGGGGRALVGTEGVGRAQVMARSTTVERGATVRADAIDAGHGGTVVVNSSQQTLMFGTLSAQGGARRGNGGFVEISGLGQMTINGEVMLTAPGGQVGTLLIDPERISIVSTLPTSPTPPDANGSIPAGNSPFTVQANTADGGTLFLLNTDIVSRNANVRLEALRSITVNGGAPIAKSNGDLTLVVTAATAAAGDGIFINAAVTITGGNALTLESNGRVTTTAAIRGNNGVTITAGDTLDLGGTVLAGNNQTIALQAARIVTQTGADIGFAGAGNGTVTMLASGSAAAGGISLGADVTTGNRPLTLQAASDAAIAQTGGRIATSDLTVRGTGAAGTNAGSITLDRSGNDITTLSEASAAGAISIRSDRTTFTVQGAAGNGVTLANGQVGGALAITGAVTGGAGGATLVADRMTIGAAVSAANVTLRQFTATQAIRLGGAGGDDPGAGTLFLSTNSLANVSTTGGTGTLTIGSSAASGAVEVFGTVEFRDAGFANDTVGVLALRGTSISQAAGDALNVRGVAIEAGSGGAALPGTANAIDQLGPVTSTGDVQVVTTRNLSVEGATDVGANTLVLRTDGTVGQTATGIVTAGRLEVRGNVGASAGAVTLGEANVVANAVVNSTGAVLLRSAHPSGLNADVTAGATSTLRGDIGLTVVTNANVGAANTLNLRSDGAIQVNTPVTAAALDARGASGADAASITATQPGNGFGSFAGAATGAISVSSGAATLTVTGATGNGVGLTATAAGGTLDITGPVAGGAGGVTLVADVMTIGAAVTGTAVQLSPASDGFTVSLGGAAAANTLVLPETALDNVTATTLVIAALGSGGAPTPGAVTVDASLSINPGMTLDLRGSTVGQAGGTVLTADRVAGSTSTGGFILNEAGNLIAGAGQIASAQDITLRTLSPVLTVSGGLTAGNGQAIALTAPRIVTQAGGTLGFAGAGNGTVTARATGAAGAGGITLGANIAAGTGSVTLEAAGDAAILQSGGTLQAADLIARGTGGAGTNAGTITLDQAGNAITTLVEARAAGAAAIRSDVATFTVQTAAADGLTLANGLAGGTLGVAVTASGGAGGVTLRSDGAITVPGTVVTSGTFLARGQTGANAASVTAQNPLNDFPLFEGRADGAINIRSAAAGGLDVTGLTVGATSTLENAAALTISGGASLGTGVTLDLHSDGAIQVTGALTGAGTLDAHGMTGASAASIVAENAGNSFTGFAGDATGQVRVRSATLTVTGLSAGATSTLRGDTTLTVSGGAAVGAANTLNLRSDGAISVTGAVTNTATLDARGATGANAGSITATNAANSFTGFAGSASGAVAVTSAPALPAGLLTVTGASGNGVTLTNATAGGTLAVTGTVDAGAGAAALAAGTITTSAAVSGGGVTMTADRLTLGAAVTGDTIALLPQTAGLNVRVGGNALAPADDPGAGTLWLPVGTLARLQTPGGTGTLVIGATATTGNVEVFNAVAFRDPGPGFGNPRLATLSLNGATVFQTGGGLNVQRVVAATVGGGTPPGGVGAGSVLLDRAGNTVTEAGAITAAGPVGLATTTELRLLGALDAGANAVALQAGGTLDQASGGVVTAGALLARSTQTVDLTAAANRIGTVAGAAAGSFGLSNAQALEVGTAGAVGAIAGASGVTVLGGAIGLQTTAGNLTQTGAGVLQASSLLTRSAGATDLTAATNLVARAAGLAAGSYGLTNGQALQVDTLGGVGGIAGAAGIAVPGGAIGLRTTVGGLSQTATGVLQANSLLTRSAGAVDLTTAANLVGTLAAVASGSLGLSNAQALQLGSLGAVGSIAAAAGVTVAGGAVGLETTAGGLTQVAAGVVQSGSLLVRSAGAVDLTTAANQVGRLAGTAAGSLGLSNAQALQLDSLGAVGSIAALAGVTVAGGAVGLETTAGGLTQVAAGAVQSSSLLVRSAGAVDLTTAGNAVGSLAGVAAGSLGLSNTQALQLDSLGAVGSIAAAAGVTVPGGAVGLQTTTGGLTQTAAGVVQSGTLLVRSAGTVDLTAAANLVGTLAGQASGSFGFSNAQALQLDAVATLGSILGLGGVTVPGGAIGLRTTAGGLSQTAFGALQSDTLLVRSAGAADLSQSTGNAVNTLASTAAGSFGFRNAQGFVLGSLGAVGGIAGAAGIAVPGGAIALQTITGGVTQTASGAVQSDSLVVRSVGATDLTTATNLVTTLAGVAGGSFAFTNAQALQIGTAPGVGAAPGASGVAVAGGAIALETTVGDLTQTAAGVLQSDTLLTRSAAATELTTAANLVGTLAGRAGGSYGFSNAQALTLDTVAAVGGIAGAAGVVVPGGAIGLETTAGGLVQSATGVVQSASLLVRSAGAVDLTQSAGNAISTLAAVAGGSFGLSNSQALTLDTVAAVGAIAGAAGVTVPGGAVGLLTTTGGIVQTASGAVQSATLLVRSAGAADLTQSATNAVSTLAGVATGSFGLRDSQALTLDTVAAVGAIAGAAGVTVTGGAIGLQTTAGGLVQSATGAVLADTLLVRSAGAVDLTQSASNAVSTLAAVAGGSFGLSNTQALTLDTVAAVGAVGGAAGVVVPGGAVGLQTTSGDLVQTATGAVQSASLLTRSAGAVDLTQSASNAVSTLAAVAGGSFGLLNSQALTLDTVAAVGAIAGAAGVVVPGGAVGLQTTSGGLVQSATGAVLADTLLVRSAGAVDLTQSASNAVSTLAAVAGSSFGLSNTQALTLDTVAAVGAISGAAGVVVPGGAIGLETTAGGLVQSATGAVQSASLLVRSAGAVDLTQSATNAVSTLAGVATGSFGLRDSQALTLDTVAAVGAIAGAAGVTVTGGAIGLQTTTGDLVQTATGAVQSASLLVRSAGAVDLTQSSGNAVSTLAAEAAGSFGLRNTQALTLDTLTAVGAIAGAAGVVVPGGAIGLETTAGGLVQSAAGVVQSASLVVRSAGATDLTQSAGNAVSTLAAVAGGAFGLSNNQALTLDTVAAVGAIAGAAGVTVPGGAIGLATTTGGIVQTASGAVQSNTLLVRSAGAADLTQSATNAVSTLAGVATGSFGLRDSQALTLDTVAAVGGIAGAAGVAVTGGAVGLQTTAGGLVQSATGAVLADTLLVRSAGAVDLTQSASNAVSTLAAVAGGSFGLSDSQALTLDTVGAVGAIAGAAGVVVPGGAVGLQTTSGGLVQSATGAVQSASLLVRSAGAVDLTQSASNAVSTLAAVAGGAFGLANSQALTLDTVAAVGAISGAAGVVVPGGTIGLETTAGGLVQSATGAVQSASLLVRSAGAVDLTQSASNAVSTLAAVAGGSFGLRNTQALTLDTLAAVGAIAGAAGVVVPGGAIGLETTAGGLVQSATGVVQSASLLTRSAGAVDLTQSAGNAISTLAAVAGGSFGLANSQALTLDTVAAVGVIAGAAGVTVPGGAVGLLTTTGGIAQTASGAVQSATVLVRSAGAADLTQSATNAVSTLAGVATGSFGLRDSQALTLDTVAGVGAIAGAAGVTVTGGAIGLQTTTGDLVQTATGAVQSASLLARSAGAVDLTQSSGNAVSTLAGTAAGSFGLSNSQALQLDSLGALGAIGSAAGVTVPGGAIALQTTAGALTQTAAAAVQSATLLTRSSAGATDLTTAVGNAVSTLAAASTGSFGFRNTQGLTLDSLSGIGAIAGAAGITTPGGAVGLQTTAGNLGQTAAGGVQSASLLARGAGAVDLTAGTNLVTTLAGTASTGFGLRNAQSLQLGAPGAIGAIGAAAGVSAATVGLQTTAGSLTQTAAGVVQSGTLLARGATAVDLTTAGNLVSTLAGDAGGSFGFRNAQALALGTSGAVGAIGGRSGILGTTVGLETTAGGLTQTAAGLVQANALLARGAGAVDLTTAANAVSSLAGSAGGAFGLRNAQGLTIGTSAGLGSLGGASGLTVAGGTVGLQTTAGGIAQTAAITGSTLLARSAAAVDLTGAANAVSTVTGQANGVFGLRNAQGFAVGSAGGVGSIAGSAGITAAGATVSLAALAGDIGQTAAITTATLQASSAGSVALGSVVNAVGTVTGSAGGGFALVTNQALTVGSSAGVGANGATAGIAAGGGVSLRTTAGGIGQTSVAAVQAASLEAVGQGTVDLATVSNRIGTAAGSAIGDFRLDNGLALTLGTAGASSGVTATQNLQVTAAGLTVASVATAQGGNATLTANAGDLAIVAGGVSAPGTVTLTSSAGRVIRSGDSVISGRVVRLDGPLGVITGPTGANAGIDAGIIDLARSTGGEVLLQLRNAVGASATTITGTQSAATNYQVIADQTLQFTATSVSVGSGGILVSSRGDISTDASTSMRSPTGGVTVASGGVTITGRSSFDGDFVVLAAGAAGSAGGRLLVGEGTRITAGRAVLFAAGGEILLGNAGDRSPTVTVAARAPDTPPTVMLEARRSTTALRDIPAAMTNETRDQAGRAIRDQRWQVQSPDLAGGNYLLFGLNDAPAGGVASGAATSNAAASVRFALDAGNSPVFLLLDGGTAGGAILAGRLGVHGTPGPATVTGAGNLSVDLVGQLGSATAGSAAEQARTTSGDPTDIARQRINGCVIGSVNCVVVPRFVPIPPNVRTNVDFVFRPGQINPIDLMVPNTGENDYE